MMTDIDDMWDDEEDMQSFQWPSPLPPCSDWRDKWDGCEKDLGCGARCTGNQPRKKEIEL